MLFSNRIIKSTDYQPKNILTQKYGAQCGLNTYNYKNSLFSSLRIAISYLNKSGMTLIQAFTKSYHTVEATIVDRHCELPFSTSIKSKMTQETDLTGFKNLLGL
jgi:hypothetical protein